MTTQHASAEASVAARVCEIDELKRQLDSSASEQSQLSELNVQQKASIDSLQQQLMQLKTEHNSTENELAGSKTLISQLQASLILSTVVAVFVTFLM